MTHHARAGRATLSIEPIPRHLGLRWSSRLRTVTVGNTSPSGGDRPAGSRRPPDVICQTQTLSSFEDVWSPRSAPLTRLCPRSWLRELLPTCRFLRRKCTRGSESTWESADGCECA